MSYIEIIFLAFALSVDACIISFTYGTCFEKERIKNGLLLASSTSFFQALMPVIGYFLTTFVREYIMPFADIIIFTIFVCLGIKFIKEAFEKKEKRPLCISVTCLLLIGIATSIDAFSAGISLSLFGNRILKPAVLIGIVTFINSSIGFSMGKLCKYISKKTMTVSAGLILIVLGINALL